MPDRTRVMLVVAFAPIAAAVVLLGAVVSVEAGSASDSAADNGLRAGGTT